MQAVLGGITSDERLDAELDAVEFRPPLLHERMAVMAMNRRQAIGMAGAALTTAATHRAQAQSATPSDPTYRIGQFLLQRHGSGLRVLHQGAPQRVLWESAADGDFLAAELATADIRAFGTPEGAYAIRDRVTARYAQPVIETIEATADATTVLGTLRNGSRSVAFRMTFTAPSSTHLRFLVTTSGGNAAPNRIILRSGSAGDEAFFGFGQQLTFFDQKGHKLPILVQEHGVGRGRPVVTELIDTFANHGGGTPFTTEAPAPHFLSSRLRSMFLETTTYSEFDLRARDAFTIKIWSSELVGRILFGETPLDLISAYTEYAGRTRPLPDWVHQGVILSVQGGTQAVRAKLKTVRDAQIPLAGLWIQDWPGVRVTSAGKQLWWDWRLDETLYPGWRALVDELAASGARMLVYINPFLSNAPGHDALFNEANARGYLVTRGDGTPYLIRNTDFSAGLIDLSNPATRRWIKDIIKTEMIGRVGASGWMADFGEALPFDGKLHEGDPAAWHNRFPEEWARVNREAIEEAGRGEDILFFNRSGFTQSPGAATAFWLGDQLQSWDGYDGIKTALVGLLSGGVSGFSLLHSDTGGYVSLSLHAFDRKLPVFARSDELLQRWIELNAFTAIFRTHEGLDPSIAAQFDSTSANTEHLRRFATIYRALAPYRKSVVAEAAQHGWPVVRHLFLHYPDDSATHDLRYQFLLGRDVMVAPVLDKGADSVEVYFPREDTWIDLWSGRRIGEPGRFVSVPAPLGQPAVFLREGGAASAAIRDALIAAGMVTR